MMADFRAWFWCRCCACREPDCLHRREVSGTLPHSKTRSDRSPRAEILPGRQERLRCPIDAAGFRPGAVALIPGATFAKPGRDRLLVRARCARTAAWARRVRHGLAAEAPAKSPKSRMPRALFLESRRVAPEL